MIPIPSLPDNSPRIIMLIGISLIIISSYLVLTHDSKIEDLYEKKNYLSDSLDILEFESDVRLEEMLDKDSFFSKKFSRNRLISTSKDSVQYTLTRTILGDSVSLLQTDSVKKYWEAWNISQNRQQIFMKKIENLDERIKSEADLPILILSLIVLIIGMLHFFYGLNILEKRESNNNQLLLRQNAGLPFTHERCQSCGKNFSSMVSYGTNLDKTNNYSFCKECYSEGDFIEPNISLNEMRIKVEKDLFNLSKRRRKRITKSLEYLERWKKDRY
ncbi:MAG: zinc ribbon domain-containing protein [Bacteroidota bacterium]